MISNFLNTSFMKHDNFICTYYWIKLWVTNKTVLPLKYSIKFKDTFLSVSKSKAEVDSSIISSCGFCKIDLAMWTILWRWPPLKLPPLSPTLEVTLWKIHYEIICRSYFCCINHFFGTSLRISKSYIFLYCSIKKNRILRNNPNLTS